MITASGECRNFHTDLLRIPPRGKRRNNPHLVAPRTGRCNAADGTEDKQAIMKIDRNRLSMPLLPGRPHNLGL